MFSRLFKFLGLNEPPTLPDDMFEKGNIDIEKLIIYLLNKNVCPKLEPKLTDNLFDDLKADGDDFGISFVSDIHNALNINIPVKEWESIITVQDIVLLVRRHCPSL